MKTKKQKSETSLREPAKKMMSFLGAVAMLGTSFPVTTTAQNVCESPSDACIERTSEKGVLNLQTSVENAGSTESNLRIRLYWNLYGRLQGYLYEWL